MGAVAAFIVTDRTALHLPISIHARLRLGAWVVALGVGITVDSIVLVGLAVLPWLAIGAATGGLTCLAMLRARPKQW